MRLYYSIFVLIVGLPLFAIAQQKVKISDIRKINVIDAEWSPVGVDRLTTFEVINETGNWLCYQTKQLYKSNLTNPKYHDKNEEYYKKETTVERKFIKNVRQQSIDSLLKSIATIKPTLNYKVLQLHTPPNVNGSKIGIFPKNVSEKLQLENDLIIRNELNKRKNVKAAIESLQHDFWTDDYPTCILEIIKNNNDTIKIISQQQAQYMLPWKINNIVSYDLNINHFFVTVINDYLYSNKPRLIGVEMSNNIYKYIYEYVAHETLIKYDWKRLYPKLYKKTTSNFSIGYQPYRNITLTSKQLPSNFYFDADIAIDDSLAINWLVSYKDTIVHAFNMNNFVFNYYKKDKQAKIAFAFHHNAPFKFQGIYFRGRDPYNEWLSLNENLKYKRDDIIRFTVEKSNRMLETWLILPDNKLVLVSYYYPMVAGVNDNRLFTGDNNQKQCIIVFDNKGNILSQYKW